MKRNDRFVFGSRVIASLAVACGLGLGGCRSNERVYEVGHESHLRASFSGSTLVCRLPETVPVESAVAAGVQTLERTGHSISTREATSHRGWVVGRPGGQRLYDKARITTTRVDSGTRVTIEVEPFGDEPTSRAVLDEMLLRLGL